MKCAMCDFNIKEVLTVLDDGKKRVELCPNHVVGMLLGAYTFVEIATLPSEYKTSEMCICCKKDAIYLKDSGIEYQVCIEHAEKLVRKNLNPAEWEILSKCYGNDAFLLHDDFYDDNGLALQPIKD